MGWERGLNLAKLGIVIRRQVMRIDMVGYRTFE